MVSVVGELPDVVDPHRDGAPLSCPQQDAAIQICGEYLRQESEYFKIHNCILA